MWGFITITKFKNAASIQLKERESQLREEEEIDCSFFSHAKTKLSVYMGVLLKNYRISPTQPGGLNSVVSTNDEELLLQILDANST